MATHADITARIINEHLNSAKPEVLASIASLLGHTPKELSVTLERGIQCCLKRDPVGHNPWCRKCAARFLVASPHTLANWDACSEGPGNIGRRGRPAYWRHDPRMAHRRTPGRMTELFDTKYPAIKRFATKAGYRYLVRYRQPDGKQSMKCGFKTISSART